MGKTEIIACLLWENDQKVHVGSKNGNVENLTIMPLHIISTMRSFKWKHSYWGETKQQLEV